MKHGTLVCDSRKGTPEIPEHRVHAVSYLPSWQLIKMNFSWATEMQVRASTNRCNEYINTGSPIDKPHRIFRVSNLVNAIPIRQHMTLEAAQLLNQYKKDIREIVKPVVAWDWIVTWEETEALAQSYPEKLVGLFRALRSRRGRRKEMKEEFHYFLYIIREVADKYSIDLERRP